MDLDLKEALIRCETDVDTAVHRLYGDEELYYRCLEMFLQDTTMSDIEQALRDESWDEAFTAAHALKGMAGNMGFIPLFHASAAFVILVRVGRTKDLDSSYKELKRCYDEIYSAIRKHYAIPAAK